MEKLDSSHRAGGSVKWRDHFRKCLAIHQVVKHGVTTQPSNSSPECIYQGENENIVHTNVYSSIIYNSLKAEIT